MEITFQAPVNQDADGFTTLWSPIARKHFKIVADRDMLDEVAFCPYTGEGKVETWFSPEMTDYLRKLAAAKAIPDLERAANHIGLPVTVRQFALPKPPIESDDSLAIHTFASGFRIKHDQSQNYLYCPRTAVREQI